MADSLINLLQTRTVLIRNGRSVGTGTLIAPGMVLTCAHVVREKNSDKIPIEVLLPDLKQPGKFVWKEEVEEVFLSDIYEERKQSADTKDYGGWQRATKEYPDVAVLKIERKNHKTHDLIALPKYGDNSKDIVNGQFLAFGFQKKDRDFGRNIPQAVSLNYSGAELDGAINKLIFSNGLIQPGMSGAALMDRESGELEGLVHMTRNPNDNLGAYVIPIEKVWEVFKEWENGKINSLFTTLRSKFHISTVKRQYNKVYPKYPMFKKYGIRLIILFILISLLAWWVYFHFGQVLDSGIIPVIIVLASLINGLLFNWLGKRVRVETGDLKDNFGKKLLDRLGYVILGIIAIITFSVWTFSSTTWIYGNSENRDVAVTLFYGKNLNKSKQDTLKPLGKIWFFNTHFKFKKELLKVVPEDRDPLEIAISPYSNLKEEIYASKFKLEPVLFIRFPNQFLDIMKSIKIEIKHNEKLIPVDSLSNEGSLMIGLRKMKITRGHKQDWEQYLARAGIETERFNDYIQRWEDFKRFEEIDLNINDLITIKLIHKLNNTELEKSFVIVDSEIDEVIKF